MRTVRVKGMSCRHCAKTVKKALEAIDGIANVAVDIETGEVSFDEIRPVDNELMKEQIKKAGYELG